MRSKLALAAVVAASFVGVTTMASAQTQPAPGVSSQGNVGPSATNTKMKPKKMSSNKKSGTTTGMSKSKSTGSTDSGADTGGMSK